MKPDVLLLDWAYFSPDPELIGEVEKSIADAAKSGQTMIFGQSRYVFFVAQVADKVLFQIKGKSSSPAPPDEIINHPKEERTKEFLLVQNGLIFDIIERETQLVGLAEFTL